MAKKTSITEAQLEALIKELAASTRFPLDEAQPDFFEISLWGLQEMMEIAYRKGLEDGNRGIKEVEEYRGLFHAKVCTLDGWVKVGEAATEREALEIATKACKAKGLDTECCAAAFKIK